MLEHVHRLFRAELDVDDAGAVTGRVVPYDEPAHVVDAEGDYDEVFTAASFAGMLQGFAKAPGRVRAVAFDLDHRTELDHRIGYAAALESRGDGLHGEFPLYAGRDVDKVRSMLRSSHTGLSVEFGYRNTRIRDDGVRHRLGVHLFAVAATPAPVYAGAVISSVRGDVDPGLPETPRLDAATARWATVLPSVAQTQ